VQVSSTVLDWTPQISNGGQMHSDSATCYRSICAAAWPPRRGYPEIIQRENPAARPLRSSPAEIHFTSASHSSIPVPLFRFMDCFIRSPQAGQPPSNCTGLSADTHDEKYFSYRLFGSIKGQKRPFAATVSQLGSHSSRPCAFFCTCILVKMTKIVTDLPKST
jgi:hypothetical protein